MKNFILFGSLLALSACSNSGTETDNANSESAGVTSSDQATAGSVSATNDSTAINPTDPASYVHKAGASDMWEIASSKAVLAKSQNADVKKFAQMMIDHHSEASEKLMSTAKTGQISAGPPQMDAMQQNMLEDITNATTPDLDATYLQHQQTAHNAALALHQNFAQNGTNDSLKKTAGEMVDVVETHIAELQKLASLGSQNN